MRLTDEEQALLAGAAGPGLRRAMEIVVALGKIYGAQELIPIESAQVAGVSYANLGEAGLEFLEEWAEEGARVRVLAMLNPAGMDLAAWREMGVPEEFAQKQARVIRAFQQMGLIPTCTCTPYLAGYVPAFGEHLAWSESSAVSFANSILGARTNREGGPSALAAAIVGRTAQYGLHLEENRRASHIVEVRCPLRDIADFGALGCLVGRAVGDGIPFFTGPAFTGVEPGWDDLKALGAAMAASGAIALYHIEGLTPEALRGDMRRPDAERIAIHSLEEGYRRLNSGARAIDLVSIGCPHASLAEIEEVLEHLAGRRVFTRLWVTTSRKVKEQAQERGLVRELEATGGKILSDTCLVVAPVQELSLKAVATNSAKEALYLASLHRLAVRFGPLERCMEAAVSGEWRDAG